MEALADLTADSLTDLASNYDISRQSFIASSAAGASSTDIHNSYSVRHVVNKKLIAQHPPNVIGGGSHALDPRDYNKSQALKDTFTGLIECVTGNLVQGNRYFILTGERYEGPFRNGVRHGNGAIVKNVYLPHYNSLSSLPKIKGESARFYGSYHEDSPSHGTLVVPALFTYQGPLRDSRPHGRNGTLVKPSGYKYEGGFRNGLYHGFGVEHEANGGIYEGNFSCGVREGFGEYTKEWKKEPTRTCTSRSSDHSITNKDKFTYHYKGQWLANQKQGEGEEILVEKEIYRGQFHANERHGYGSITFESSVSPFRVNNENQIEGRKLSQSHEGNSDKEEDKKVDDCINGNHSIERETEATNVTLPLRLRPEKPIIAEGEFRAGHPLDGTNGWTLIYDNGDCYVGYASKFKPKGYGVMRFGNKDIYTGEFEQGKRKGEGCFISGDGKEEYVGEWDEDKIVPYNEGERIDRITKLTDMVVALLDRDEDSDLLEKMSGDSSFRDQRDLLETIVQMSLCKSIDRMNECKGSTHNDNWPLSGPTGNRKYVAAKVTPQKEHPKKSAVDSKTDELLESVNALSQQLLESVSINNRLSDEVRCKGPTLKTYKNGDTYLGAYDVDGFRQGYGVYVSSASGSTYSGLFEKDARHGHGILIHALGKYVGDFLNDAKEGEGTLIFNDASSYNGNFQKNKFHGTGTLCTKDGSIYVGNWYNGLKSGQGCETLPDGRVYIGFFKDGYRSGSGTLREKARGDTIYRGSWLNGIFHGEGICIERRCRDSPNQYEGEFFNGLRHGFGQLKNKNSGLICKGPWHCDKPLSGKWRITYPNGCIYSGNARIDDDNHISAAWTAVQGSNIPSPSMPVNFEINTPIPDGFGAIRYTNENVYIGQFKNGAREGYGSLFVNGIRSEGFWDGDNLIDKAR